MVNTSDSQEFWNIDASETKASLPLASDDFQEFWMDRNFADSSVATKQMTLSPVGVVPGLGGQSSHKHSQASSLVKDCDSQYF